MDVGPQNHRGTSRETNARVQPFLSWLATGTTKQLAALENLPYRRPETRQTLGPQKVRLGECVVSLNGVTTSRRETCGQSRGTSSSAPIQMNDTGTASRIVSAKDVRGG